MQPDNAVSRTPLVRVGIWKQLTEYGDKSGRYEEQQGMMRRDAGGAWGECVVVEGGRDLVGVPVGARWRG